MPPPAPFGIIRAGMSRNSGIEIFERAAHGGDQMALQTADGDSSYRELLEAAERVAAGLLGERESLDGERIAFLVQPSLDYVRLQWGIWRAGGVAVPLCPLHPVPELRYVVEDSDASAIIAQAETTATMLEVAAETGRPLLQVADLVQASIGNLPSLSSERPAMILYTSGTTSRPKGVLTSHACIRAQITSLVDAWGWAPEDRILCVLPLHHLHGIINVLGCALWSGAACVVHPAFDAHRVWRSLCDDDLSLFMGVPTIYSRLIKAWDEAPAEEQQRWSAACGGLRLMVSGSAALPQSTLDRWLDISGHVLLERYGMTETGMILSNPLVGERRRGAVGLPLPGVDVRLVDDEGEDAENEGEIFVRGAGVFEEYWQRQAETEAAFDDGWFRTGDVAVFEEGSYRLLGRTSVDIIKTGGYKVSALEIEEVLREHPQLNDCAVVGVPDDDWGERVSAAILVSPGETVDVAELREWAKERLAVYKVPRTYLVLDDLPRNALGKVTKNAVKELFD